MSAELKILHSYKVYRPDLDGGIPFAIATLSNPNVSRNRNKILVARLRGSARKYDYDGVPVRAVSSWGTIFSTPLAPAFPFELIRRARESDILVHHAPFPIVDIAMPYLPKDMPLIVYWHADIIGRSFLRKLLNSSILRTLERADRILVSDQTAIDGSPVLPAFASKCAIVPFGIDADYWSTCSSDEASLSDQLRQQYPRMILGIGRLVPYKGFDVLLQALRRVDAHVVLIGEGPLAGELQRMAVNLGVADRVTFAGRVPRSHVKAYLHAARVFAFPSVTRAEAFGIVQLEAMAAGLPIVNTALDTAVPHIARHNQEALTVPTNTPENLAEALSSILDDPALAQRLGEAGRIRARVKYNQENYVSRVENIYQDVIRRRMAP
jgi:glycosyltransferase involved in cell wall biosynthesis